MTVAPSISIIVPVYKGIHTLRAAVGSLSAQTFADWEAVLVDDGATDGSGDLAEALAANEPRVRVIHQSNGGTSVARNTGLSAARGRYIAFLDEDDAYHPQFLETLFALAESTGADVAGCAFFDFDDSASPVFGAGPEAGVQPWIGGRQEIAAQVEKFYYGIPFEVWRNLYRRELVVDVPFKPGVRVEQDLLWHYSLLPRVTRYAMIPWQGYAWRKSATGGFLHPNPESLISLLHSYRYVLDEIAPALGMTHEQRARLGGAMATDIRWNVWRHLQEGLRLDRASSRALRAAVRALDARGACLCACLAGPRRVKWRLFMLTGFDFWVRL